MRTLERMRYGRKEYNGTTAGKLYYCEKCRKVWEVVYPDKWISYDNIPSIGKIRKECITCAPGKYAKRLHKFNPDVKEIIHERAQKYKQER